MTQRKFSEPVEALRKILGAKSHGVPATVEEDGIWLTYRSRYQAPVDKVAELVKQAGGDVLEKGKTGKVRPRMSTSKSQLTLTQPHYVTFSVGIDEDIFLKTGERLPEMQTRAPRIVMGRLVK